jgi:ABC-2 type transport system permease protein
MNWRAIRAVVLKDLMLFSRNRFFVVITLLGLISYIAIYWVMPDSVSETVKIGLLPPNNAAALQEMGEGLEIVTADSQDLLREGVIDGDYVAGVAMPSEEGDTGEITVFYTSDTLEEVQDFINLLVTEIAYQQAGESLNISWQPQILGEDRLGDQIPYRDKMRPLFAVMIMASETFVLASLIGEEVERRTGRALLITPMTVRDLFTAKAIMGILMAFTQAFLFVLVVRGMVDQPLIIITALFLGAVLITGVGFLMAALGKDFVTTMAWGVPVLLLFSLPAVGIMMPGVMSDWIKGIPSYYLTDTIYQCSVFGSGWGEVWSNLAILMGCNAAILLLGVLALRRKFRCD